MPPRKTTRATVVAAVDTSKLTIRDIEEIIARNRELSASLSKTQEDLKLSKAELLKNEKVYREKLDSMQTSIQEVRYKAIGQINRHISLCDQLLRLSKEQRKLSLSEAFRPLDFDKDGKAKGIDVIFHLVLGFDNQKEYYEVRVSGSELRDFNGKRFTSLTAAMKACNESHASLIKKWVVLTTRSESFDPESINRIEKMARSVVKESAWAYPGGHKNYTDCPRCLSSVNNKCNVCDGTGTVYVAAKKFEDNRLLMP